MSLEFDKIMEPGDPLDVDVLTKDNTVIKLKSNIQLIKDNMEFFISAPIYQAESILLKVGQWFWLRSRETPQAFIHFMPRSAGVPTLKK